MELCGVPDDILAAGAASAAPPASKLAIEEVIFDNEIVGLQERADCVHVQFKNGSERRFDLVIGADGLHSEVRRLAFWPQHQFEKPLGYAVAAFEVCGYRPRDPGVYLMYGQPG